MPILWKSNARSILGWEQIHALKSTPYDIPLLVFLFSAVDQHRDWL